MAALKAAMLEKECDADTNIENFYDLKIKNMKRQNDRLMEEAYLNSNVLVEKENCSLSVRGKWNILRGASSYKVVFERI